MDLMIIITSSHVSNFFISWNHSLSKLDTEKGISGNMVPESMIVKSFFTNHLRVLMQCANPLKRKQALFTTEEACKKRGR